MITPVMPRNVAPPGVQRGTPRHDRQPRDPTYRRDAGIWAPAGTAPPRRSNEVRLPY